MTQDLLNGVKDFKRFHYGNKDDALMTDLVENGQSPKYFIISCIDSRCNPGTIFRAKPGIFLAHKAMGAIIRPYKQGTALAAALQFALDYNTVDTIIVLGHTQCGAVKALVENLEDVEISSFVSVTKKALEKAKTTYTDSEQIISETEKQVVLQGVENIKQYPSVARALSENRVKIKPWIFDIKTGDLLEHDPVKSEFISISPPTNNHEEEPRKNA